VRRGTPERLAHRFDALAAGGVDLISWIACAEVDLGILRGGRLKPGLFHLVSRLRLRGDRASGDVEGQRQLIRRADLGQQRFQRVPQVGNRGFRGRTIA
jgi:hypothetical protein